MHDNDQILATALGKGPFTLGYKLLFESGAVDIDKYAKSQVLHGMKGNSAIARLVKEIVDGKEDDNINITHSASGELLDVIKAAYLKRKK